MPFLVDATFTSAGAMDEASIRAVRKRQRAPGHPHGPEIAQHSLDPCLLGATSRCETAGQLAHKRRVMPIFLSIHNVSMDLRVGGDWSARMVLGDGMEIAWHGSYLGVEAPHRLFLSLSDRPDDQFERVTVDLKEVEGGTEMTFTQSGGNVPPENYAQAEEGWRAFFDNLSDGLSA